MAGWMISVNGDNDNGNLTPADIVKDGDVIRYQFSVYGWGADVGLSNYAGMEPLKVADKTTLTKELAKINKNKAVWMNNENVKTAYENAIKVATKLMATQDEVDEVVAELKKVENETTTVQDADNSATYNNNSAYNSRNNSAGYNNRNTDIRKSNCKLSKESKSKKSKNFN